MKKATKKLTNLFIIIVTAFTLCISSFSISAAAANNEENRILYEVVDGTAKKLGTDTEIKLTSSYLEEWEISEEAISGLSKYTKELLLKAKNAEELPVNIEEVTAENLTSLAKKLIPEAQTVYQGYASLNIKGENEGYTYGVSMENNLMKGYYVSLSGKTIYEFEVEIKETTWPKLKGNTVVYSNDEENGNSNNSSYYERTSDSNSNSNSDSNSDSSKPEPAPKPTPEPPKRPGDYNESGVGSNYIPGPKDES